MASLLFHCLMYALWINFQHLCNKSMFSSSVKILTRKFSTNHNSTNIHLIVPKSLPQLDNRWRYMGHLIKLSYSLTSFYRRSWGKVQEQKVAKIQRCAMGNMTLTFGWVNDTWSTAYTHIGAHLCKIWRFLLL